MQAVLEPELDAAAKLVASKNPAELEDIRADRLKFWTQRALFLQSKRRSWLQVALEALELLLAAIRGPFLDEMALACGQDSGLAEALRHGLPFVGVLPPGPGFCKPVGDQRCDLSVPELRKQRSDRNKYVLSKVQQLQRSGDLWDKTVADATNGYMSWPMRLEQLDLRQASVTRRLPVRE